MDKFPIGFWNYTRTGQLGPKDVHDWNDLGMTFAMSPEFNPEKDDRNVMLSMLDECEKLGIKIGMTGAEVCDILN